MDLLPFIFGGPKLIRALIQVRRYRSWLVNQGDQVERWRELCTRLDVCDRKLAKMLLDT